MAGKQSPSAFGPNAAIDEIDTGTSARMSTPKSGPQWPTFISATSVADPVDAPSSGGIPYAIGQSSVVRIPIPGTDGIAIELTARGWTPKGASTSTLFFQGVTGQRHLRLDYGHNVRPNAVDYHSNQKSTAEVFKITGPHQLASRRARAGLEVASLARRRGPLIGGTFGVLSAWLFNAT